MDKLARLGDKFLTWLWWTMPKKWPKGKGKKSKKRG